MHATLPASSILTKSLTYVLSAATLKGGPINPSAMFRHTTDLPNGQSILERKDLDELMAIVRGRQLNRVP